MGKEPSRAFRLVDDLPSQRSPRSTSGAGEASPAAGQGSAVFPSRSIRERGEKTRYSPRTDCAASGAPTDPADHTSGTACTDRAGRQAQTKGNMPSGDPVQDAIARALSLLTYGDMSRARLLRKLHDRGIDEDTAAQAVDALEVRGYLRESEACLRRAEQGVRKGWGPRRISEDLYAQRYPRELIEQAMEELSDTVDFAESCATVIKRKYHGVPSDRNDRRRLTAALARLGYGMEDIRAAMQSVAGECE